MKREKFLFELIDNYAYMTCLGCMIMENYLTVDKTKDYIDCADQIGDCLDFYDQLYEKMDKEIYTEEEADTILSYLILSLRQKAIQSICKQLKDKVCSHIDDADRFLEENLLVDSRGRPQEITERLLKEFIKKLRDIENCE